ncbi:MAG: helix-hairpin-helix domain-containing protein [Turicibacter sp.]|nr:helix-hairpin-helix domain-containing protein [Turicibacter sp.]
MNYILAEAISHEQILEVNGEKLYRAKVLETSSSKFIAFSKILENSPVSYFIKIGQYLATFLKIENPIVFVTDWTDPTELIGLRLETGEGKEIDYPNLSFLAFYTDWEKISTAEHIEKIFAHEYSHMWLEWLGRDSSLSLANKFHTSTSITDYFMAFFEGLAESLEIVTKDLMGYKLAEGELWDGGLGCYLWLCDRDEQLRYHAVKNNRFIYHTATPYIEDFDTYSNLHLAHITSSAFTPERVKNGSQMLASEGAIASIFYQIYAHELFKNTYMEESFYTAFGADIIDPICNLYLKILYAISKIDLQKPSLTTDFIRSYGECFPSEKEAMYNVFAKTTNFATMSNAARDACQETYRIGRRGNMDELQKAVSVRNSIIDKLRMKMLNGQIALDEEIYGEVWIEGDEKIPPTPWEPDVLVNYRFNVNTATAVDFMALKGVSMNTAEKLVIERDRRRGFTSVEEFTKIKSNINI